MRPGLWFVVPAHGRLAKAAVCLRQLRRTIDKLEREGIDAAAVVVACDENLDTARQLGFGTIERDNTGVGRRYNDGIQYATDPACNRYPADFVVPCGSDDWIDHRILRDPDPDSIRVFRRASFVNEQATEIAVGVTGRGGWGIRVYPAWAVRLAGYRPAEEDIRAGCDTSIMLNLRRHNIPVSCGDTHDRQIVDWKTQGEQLHAYRHVSVNAATQPDPFSALAPHYPASALNEMRALY